MPVIHWLMGLPPLIGGTIFSFAALFSGLGAYAVARLVVGKRAVFENSNLALQLFRVVATLLVLLLSLTFADVRIEAGAIRSSVEVEAGLLGDTFKNLEAFDSAEAESLTVQLLEYIDAVIEDEWEALRRGEIAAEVVDAFRNVEFAVLTLETTTPLQEELRRRMLDDIDAVSDSRLKRLTKVSASVPVFVYVAVLAFLWSNAMLSVFTARNKAIYFIGGYCAFVGVVIYVILAMGDYFDGVGAVNPDSLELLSDYVKGLREDA
jgi:ABC-type multidrug transport system fused ATPase/permease subunit